jgi:WD40 repeat protein
VKFSPDGKQLAAMDDGGELRMWEVATGKLLFTRPHRNTYGSVVFSMSGELLASIDDDHNTVVWNTSSGEEVMRIEGEAGSDPGVAFVPGQRQLLLYGIGAAVWDIDAGTVLQKFAGEDSIYSAVFDKSGQTLLLGGDAEIEWWDWANARRLFSRDASYVIRMVADDDSNTFLSLSFSDQEVRAWDFASGRLLRRIPYARFVHAFAIDPKGKWLAVSGSDWDSGKDVIEFAEIRPPDLLARACEYAHRSLTEEEWDRYFGDVPYRRTCEEIE